MNLKEHSAGERKIDSYYSAYDKHLVNYEGKDVRLLEIGIQGGGSLRMWKNCFPNSEIVGIDIDPSCKELDVSDAKVFIGDQTDKEFLEQFRDFDIIIDDGGHTMHQQQTSFEVLFPLLKSGGLYVIEDLHTSFWREFADAPISTTDYLYKLANGLNHAVANGSRLGGRELLSNEYKIESIHFHPSICFIYKA